MLRTESYPPTGRTRERLADAERRFRPLGENRRARYGIRSYPRSCWPDWYFEAYCPVHDSIVCGCSK